MAWLEITIDTAAEKCSSVVTVLTAKGFADLVIEDQEEFETFLEENKAYWDYIDEEFQEKLQGLSHIKLYLEDTDTAGMERLKKAVAELKLSMTVAPWQKLTGRKAGKTITRPRKWARKSSSFPTGWQKKRLTGSKSFWIPVLPSAPVHTPPPRW